jgi:predicted ester cyclase
MPDACEQADAEELVRLFWERANVQDWAGLGRLLAPGIHYEVPQTRECIDGADGFVDFFATWPQPWRVQLERVVSDGRQVAVQMVFDDGRTQQTAVGFYGIEAGRIAHITEFWPEPYEPPPRATRHVRRY